MRPFAPPIPHGALKLVREIKRKILHILLSLVPLLFFLLPGRLGVLGLIIATFTIVVFDIIRLRNRRLNALFLKHLRRLLRKQERAYPLGATYYVVAAMICVLVFDRTIAIAALAFLVIGDTFAALVGNHFGKPRFQGKSIEGSLACFASCWLVGSLFPLDQVVVIAGALAATLAEAVPLPVDDNFRIPLLSGLVMQVVTNVM